jgi:hypothetical protein
VLRKYRDVALRRLDTTDSTIIWNAYGRTVELYDRTSDPDETRNLARRRPEQLDRLRAELRALVPPWSMGVEAKLSDSSIDQLRNLGYLN